jgi:serine/threonine protein kinase
MIVTNETSRGPEYNPVIVDFGLSKVFLSGERNQDRVGTLVYSSPEMLLRGYSHGLSTDVWSAGVLLYILLSGAYPFIASPFCKVTITYLIVRGQVDMSSPAFHQVTPLAKDLLIKML